MYSLHEIFTGLLAAVAAIWVLGVIAIAVTDQVGSLLAHRRQPVRRHLPH